MNAALDLLGHHQRRVTSRATSLCIGCTRDDEAEEGCEGASELECEVTHARETSEALARIPECGASLRLRLKSTVLRMFSIGIERCELAP
jgi:hypothetical protein